MPRSPAAYDITDKLGALSALDAPAEPLAKAVRDATKSQPQIKDALSGTWLGHALHPLLQVVPVGTWTSTVLLDWIGGRDGEESADRLLASGLLAALPTVASGLSDWADTTPASDSVRRVGLVHATSNATGMALFVASLAARRRGARGRGKALALAGYAAVTVGGYLGGHLSYAEGVGVDETAYERYPEEWTRVLDDAALGEGELRAADAGGVTVLLARDGGRVHALSDRCCHRAGPLHEGTLANGCVTCPLHGSTYRLADGSVVRGPAAYPQPTLEARVVDGGIEVRAPR
jgi:nitrite reductase/ring-hydroxylating ferredoxin subunit